MKERLVEQLLSKIMDWSEEKIVEELQNIQFLAEMKYDHYDQFMPGTRFLGSLAKWLNSFDDMSDRNVMFDFVKKKLVFISSSQMSYLITLLYRVKILSTLVRETAKVLNLPEYKVYEVLNSEEFKIQKRLSLFIGLSDGAHMDIVRRTAGLDNEQVLNNYYPDNDKIKEMEESLCKDGILNNIDKSQRKYNSIFLIDDFTASGTSFIRKDKNGEFHGKLTKIMKKLYGKGSDNNGNPFGTIIKEEGKVHIYFCLATEYALQYIKDRLNEYKKENNFDVEFDVGCIQKITSNVSEDIKNDKKIIKIISEEKYINTLETIKKSYSVGNGKKYYLGYADGALPLVLSHNTPNNSILVLWQNENDMENGTNKYPSLFPRINRH